MQLCSVGNALTRSINELKSLPIIAFALNDTTKESIYLHATKFIRCKYVYNYHNHIPRRYISKRSYENKLLQVGDIIVEKSGGSPTQSTGRVCLITPELIEKLQSVDCSNFCAAFRVKKEWDAEYIYLYIQYFYNMGAFFNFEGKTSGIKNLQLEQAYQAIEIKPISIAVQKKLAKTIRTIDGKMAINRSINQNLEAMAKQLYDYWFMQFDFPNEEGKPYKSSGGEMVWNEKLKREIPKGWEIRPLNSLITVKDGTHESPKQQLEGRYLITSKHLLSSGIDYNTAYYISEEDYIAINKRSQVETNDILFSMIGTIGNKYLVAEKNVNFAIKNMALLKTSKSIHIMYFLWLYLSSWDYKHYEFNAISGSIQKFLSLDAMRNIPVPFNYDIAVAFNKQVSNICQCIINLKEENIQLIKQRNELLPLLMNGQVSVNSDLSVYKKRRGKVPSSILNDVSDI